MTSALEYQIVRIRMIEEAIAHRYCEKEMRCPVHLSIGQEAIAVGVCSYLSFKDYAVSGHRAHAHYLAKGGSLKRMLAEIYGKEAGACRGRGGSMHLVDLAVGFLGSTPIVGGTIPIGVGISLGAKMQNEDRITVIFFGEGSTEEGVFCESLNFTALKQLSVLFICENNLYSVYSPLEVRQSPQRSIIHLAQAHNIFALKGNGNSLQEVMSLTAKGIDHIRSGGGPALLEFSTYRFCEHCGPNRDPYQPLKERAFWEARDPIQAINIDRQPIEKEIEDAFAFAQMASFSKIEIEERHD
ncbi:MAG: thiamine pyrophosphate-dependent dehydrogenase E1 component subunit alpha [Chlamydiales bacterium]